MYNNMEAAQNLYVTPCLLAISTKQEFFCERIVGHGLRPPRSPDLNTPFLFLGVSKKRNKIK
jgi:hypothetical protein